MMTDIVRKIRATVFTLGIAFAITVSGVVDAYASGSGNVAQEIQATNASGIATNASRAIQNFMAFVFGVGEWEFPLAHLIGIAVFIIGLLKLSQVSDNRNKGPAEGIATLLVGATLLSFAVAVRTFGETLFGQSNVELAAIASTSQTGTTTSSTLGDVFRNVQLMMPSFGLTIMIGTSLMGLAVIFSGLLRLKNFGEGKPDTGPKEGIVRIIVGALMVSMGYLLSVLWSTFFGATLSINPLSGNMAHLATLGTSTNAPVANGANSFQTAVAYFAANAADPLTKLTIAAGTVIGLALMAHGLYEATKLSAQGMQREAMPSVIMKLVIGTILLNADVLMRLISSSFGLQAQSGLDTNFSSLASSSITAYNSAMTSMNMMEACNQITKLTSYVLFPFGLMAFIRGWMLVKATVDGRSQGGIGNGLVYVVGGVTLCNSLVFYKLIVGTMVPASVVSKYMC
jgi:hypothetical protein